eukprot:CAMPEP_0181336132 /NCGR_PEP_ID=MMETSP1101-20121128/27243_1 /TAXON_ID=46948 /ORGANISM="Rhodomonas abbreviata, Strain Caron Lab Isolate" /LENGTH=92 /DNA_ID=CAMNT_0023446381 /DNA_START=56 /DNA_END=331 /DNA_ORIENTATION=+
MTRDAIPWTTDPGAPAHQLGFNNAGPQPAIPFGGTAHLVPVAQGHGPPMSMQQQMQQHHQQQQQHHQQMQQQYYGQQQQMMQRQQQQQQQQQ